MSKTFSRLGAALDRQSWEWLLEANEDIATAVVAEVQAGATPDDLRRYILAHVGADRGGLAARVMSAARHVAARGKA